MGTDYISRESAILEIKRFIGYLDEDMIERLQIAIRRIPAADVGSLPQPNQKCNVKNAGRTQHIAVHGPKNRDIVIV